MSEERGGILTTLVRFSIRFRGIVLTLAIILLGYGTYSFTQAKYDVFPEFAPPQAVIQTEAAGLSPEQVEVLVTQPIENAVNGVPDIQALRSASLQGLSLVTVIFKPASDIYRDRQVVAERLASVGGQLPAGVETPVLTPLTSSTSTLLVTGLTADKRSLMDLRTAADWTVRPRLLAVPGVAKVSIFGGEVRQIQIQVHPERLIRFNLGMNEVLAAARNATGIWGAGFVETRNQRIVLQIEGQGITPETIGRTALATVDGASVTLANVANVVEGPEPPVGAASINGRDGVMLVVSSQYGANTQEVTRAVEQALEELRPSLEKEGMSLHPDLFRPANFIDTATRSVRSAMVLGGVLVVVVLFLFLFDWRSSLISCVAIPLSLLAAVMVMVDRGFTLNTMTLGGLAIAIGQVVDDAVINVENIIRRLREHRRIGSVTPVWQVVLDATIEVQGAVVYATFAVIVVFFPILSLSGIAGRLFSPLGIAYILAVLASLVVALTVTPALAMLLLTGPALKSEEPPVMRHTRGWYESLLRRVEARPKPILVAVGLLVLLGLAIIPFLRGSFLPELREGQLVIHMSEAPGSSLEESLHMGREVTRALLTLPQVRSVAQQVGRAERADDVWGPHYSELYVSLKPVSGEEAELAVNDIRRRLSQFPGVNSSVKTFLTERVEETLSGYTAAVAVNVFGKDLDVLDRSAAIVARELSAVPGATEVLVQSPPGLPQLSIRLRPSDVARWGFTPGEILESISAAYQGEIVGQVYEGNRVFAVSALLTKETRRSPALVADLPLRNAAGTYVALKQVADVYPAPGRYQILHEGARRVQTITANVAGRDVASFVDEATRRIGRDIPLPPATYVEFAGTAAAQRQSKRDLLVNSVVAGVGVVLLLAMIIRRGRNLMLVLINLPFALVGGVLAAFAMGGNLTLGAMVGFVTLFGITLRNSIMMISHYEHLVEKEGMVWGIETAITGAGHRLTPILMTSIVTALGVLPLAIGMHQPGREIEGPMAMVILGGLLTSMVLNLLVLPTLALRYGRFDREAEG